MTLYRKLFGLDLMAPADDGSDLGGGTDERGDNFTAAPTDADVKLATGETEEDGEETQTRDSSGKFAKKERTADDDGPKIPKSRFDDAVGRERAAREAAERRLAELERAQGQIQRNADLSELESTVKNLRAQERKALISGDDEKAEQFSEQADRLNRQIAIQTAGDMSAATKEQALEEMRMDLAIEHIEQTYPQFDDKSDAFDPELTDDVLDKQRGFMERERLSPSKALLKAVKYVLSKQAATPLKDEGKGLSAANKVVGRKEAAVAKNLDASKRQPASTKGAGADSDRHGQTAELPEADQMSYDEFSALPETTKARMRGDFIG